MYRFLFLSVLLMLSSTLNAAESDRAQKWEFYLAPQYIDSKNINFSDGTSADINDIASLIFGFGYNFDSKMNLGMYFNAGSANYKGTYLDSNKDPQTYSATMYSSSMNAAFTYNFLESDFTPYIEANLGLTYIDSGIPSGLSNGCVWLPWYGYVCGTYTTSYASTRFNYGGQLGVRYDLNAMFFKAGVGLNYVDISGANNPAFTLYNISVGFKFQ